MTPLNEQLEGVTDEATFLAFVQALIVDRRGDAEHWENESIEDFLEGASDGQKIQGSALNKAFYLHPPGESSQLFSSRERSTNSEHRLVPSGSSPA